MDQEESSAVNTVQENCGGGYSIKTYKDMSRTMGPHDRNARRPQQPLIHSCLELYSVESPSRASGLAFARLLFTVTVCSQSSLKSACLRPQELPPD